ncbi:MAG: Crp/Fnr family transcriptional regulator [Saprospiraceae bacterium]
MSILEVKNSEITSFFTSFEDQIQITRLPNKAVIFSRSSSDKSLYYIAEGIVKYLNGSGKIEQYFVSNDIFGDENVLNFKNNNFTAIAQQPCTLFKFHNVDFTAYTLHQNGLYNHLMKALNNRKSQREQFLETLVFEPVKLRIARILNHIATHSGKSNIHDQILICNIFTQGEIADIAFTTRQTVAHIFKEFYDQEYCSKLKNHSLLIHKKFFDEFKF